jgi:KUP system potassium uptake protein
MVILAAVATVIASQAVITGAYSLTRQAIQLGLLPRFRDPPYLGIAFRPDLHSARQQRCCSSQWSCLVLLFKSSSSLASAYGISVTGTMVVTAMMGFIVIWRWLEVVADRGRRADRAVPVIDVTFLTANLLKVFERRLGAAGAGRHR